MPAADQVRDPQGSDGYTSVSRGSGRGAEVSRQTFHSPAELPGGGIVAIHRTTGIDHESRTAGAVANTGELQLERFAIFGIAMRVAQFFPRTLIRYEPFS